MLQGDQTTKKKFFLDMIFSCEKRKVSFYNISPFHSESVRENCPSNTNIILYRLLFPTGITLKDNEKSLANTKWYSEE